MQKTKKVRKATPRRKTTTKRAAVVNRQRKRPLHKKILLHPIVVMMLLFVGVIISGLTGKSIADSYSISATIPAAPLLQPAIITSPTDRSNITSTPILVSGSCPDGSYVELMRNGSLSGIASCTSNTFQISTDLSDGSNQLLAQDYNFTDQAGPTSSVVTVQYTAPAEPPNNPTTPTNPTAAQPTYEAQNSPTATNKTSYDNSGQGPLLLTSTYKYSSVTSGQVYQWELDLTGGTPPYVVTVEWGDNSTSSLIFKTDPEFNIQHNYTAAGNYNIIVIVVDALGEKAEFQLTAAIKTPGAKNTYGNFTGVAGSEGGSGTTIVSRAQKWLWVIWPVYLVIALMTLSFWLGEREEYLNVFRRHRQAYKHR